MAERTKIAVKAPEAKRENTISQKQKPDFSQPISSPIDHIMFLQRTIGNQAVLRLLKGTGFRVQGIGIQPKLTIGQPNDVYEQEADRVAEQVMRMPEPAVQKMCAQCASGGPSCPKCAAEKEKLNIRRKPESSASDSSVPNNFVSSVGSGQPLDKATRDYFEPRFGADLSHVHVHSGQQAAESANFINALAYTLGNNVVFGAGQYKPNTIQGKRLLAHELTHVVQQKGVSIPMIQRDCSDPDFCRPYATTAEADSAALPPK